MFTELFVIDFVVIPADALFGHARRAAGFENVEGAAGETFRHKALRLFFPQHLVIEVIKSGDIAETGDLLQRIPTTA
jgi:hypothetical protein